jgi:predicted ATPase
MTMNPGSRLGSYEIVSPLGRGGMGIVYLARDTSLDREVAIKVLPAEVATNPERLAWFEREAKSLAALNHPNIATIHGFEASPDATRFIVLERIAGETLQQRLRRGPLTIEESVAVGLQIADALGAAHERGIVHRDVKPGNVMVTPKGRVKVLDFGLAMRLHVHDSEVEGELYGTPGYASPEQLHGRDVDLRSDVFAFGCVLFECLAGARAFPGRSPEETVTATLHAEPKWESLPADASRRLRSFLGRCLEKDATRRPESMGAVTDALHEIAGSRAIRIARPGAPSGRHNLPATITPFIGREREVEECLRILGTTRLLTLLGVAGCGKTRLALEVAGRATARHPDGVWFLDLAPLRDEARILEGIGAVVGVKEAPGVSLSDGLVDALQEKRVLLLLDNCEHVAAPLSTLARRLLQACAGLQILTTSREALEVQGERLLPVEPLAAPDPDMTSVRAALRSESVQFFVDRAQLADPEFALDEDNAAAVVDICRQLEGIPLALELAAARLQLLSLEQVRSRLEDRFRLLAAPTRVSGERHRTLHAAIEWSYDQMAEVERACFRRLAVFSGGWTLEDAAVVVEDDGDEFATLDLLTRLWNKSLVLVDRDAAEGPRYRYLETIREIALEKLAGAGDEAEIRRRHADCFMVLAENHYGALARDLAKVIARLGPESHNLLDALDWNLRAGGREEQALRLVSNLWSFWMDRGEFTTGRRALRSVLDRPGVREPTGILSRAIYGEGWLALHQGDWDAARARIAESLEVARACGDSRAESRALAGLGVVALHVGDYAAAREYGLQSLELNRRLGNEKGISASLNGLGNLAFRQGDFEGARRYMEEALELHRKRADMDGIASALSNLAEAYLRLGMSAEGRRALVECLEVCRTIQAKLIISIVFANVAKLATTPEEAWQAARLVGAGEAFWKSCGFELPASDRKEHEAELSRLGGVLGGDRLGRARREGAALGFDEAIDDATRYLRGADPETVAGG